MLEILVDESLRHGIFTAGTVKLALLLNGHPWEVPIEFNNTGLANPRVNPLSSNSDQHRLFPTDIHTLSRGKL